MRVVCPSCNAAYDVPERLLGGGARRLHCNRCGHEWTLDPMDASAAIAQSGARDLVVATPPPPAAERPIPVKLRPDDAERRALRAAFAERPVDRGATMGAVIGWTLTAAILIGIGYLGYVRRDAVMTAWPASERLYSALGLR